MTCEAAERPAWAREASVIARLSDQVCVPFEARKLHRATVVWINPRWLLAAGQDPLDDAARERAGQWLLAEFAYVVPRPEDDDRHVSAITKQFTADRYGETATAYHGGSGRAGSDQGYQVKGIGRTPLVGDDADWNHAHGCAWMEEAIREAVYSEIFAAEFPVGAVRTVAIIDTHLHAELVPGQLGERRALIVREDVIRLAHFQRAPHFFRAGHYRSDQLADAARVRDAARWLATQGADDQGVPLPLGRLCRRVADQMAFGDVFRLTHGGFLSSNVAMDGSLLDFGSARALLDWRTAELSVGGVKAGHDSVYWLRVIESVAGQLDGSDGTSLQQAFVTHYCAALAKWIPILWGFGETELGQNTCSALANATMEVMNWYRKREMSFSEADPGTFWPWSTQTAGAPPSLQSLIYRVQDALTDAQREAEVSLTPEQRQRIFERYMGQREVLFREELQHMLFSTIVPAVPEDRTDPAAVRQFFRYVHTFGRRYWPSIDPCTLVAQGSDGLSHALLIEEAGSSGVQRLFFEVPAHNGQVLAFGRWHDQGDFASTRHFATGYALVEVRDFSVSEESIVAQFGSKRLVVRPVLRF